MRDLKDNSGIKRAARAQAVGTVLFKPDPALLERLLQPLVAEGCDVFIYVNGQLEAPVEGILSAHPNVKLIRSSANIGQGAGLNALLAAAAESGQTSIILFDQDSTPGPGFAALLANRFAALGEKQWNTKIAAVGPLLVPPKGSAFLPIKYWRRPPQAGEPPGAVEFLPTSGTLVSVAAWKDVGPFREDYFIGGIDVEWGYRARAIGWISVVADDIQMHHRWGEEHGNQHFVQSQFLRQPAPRVYYYIRNAIDGMRLPHMPWSWKWRQATRMTAQIGLGLISRGQTTVTAKLVWRALSDGYAGRLGPSPPDVGARAHAAPPAQQS
jgi:rhamnosyltransferase